MWLLAGVPCVVYCQRDPDIQLQALETYKKACVAIGMGGHDVLDPATWLDGDRTLAGIQKCLA